MTFATLGAANFWRRFGRALAALNFVTAAMLVALPADAQNAPDPGAANAEPPADVAVPEIGVGEPIDPAQQIGVEEPIDPAQPTILATVNGEPVTERDLAIMAELIGDGIFQFPEENRFDVLVEEVIAFKLAVLAAQTLGLDQNPDFLAAIDDYRLQQLRSFYLETVIAEAVTEEDVIAAYNESVAAMDLPVEVKVRHIQVGSEAEANEVLERLNAGESFVDLAATLSLDQQSAANGGLAVTQTDNGGIKDYWAPGELVQEFDDVVFSIEPGTVHQAPIPRASFWHVLLVDDRRQRPPPPYEQMRAVLYQTMANQAYFDTIDRLREAATIEFLADLALPPANELNADPAVDPAPAPVPAAGD